MPHHLSSDLLYIDIPTLCAGALTKSQFPVFTIYAQKSCLGVKPCERAWCFDRVLQHRLQGHVKREAVASSRQDCLEMCLGERDFICSGFQHFVVHDNFSLCGHRDPLIT
uniref:Apple domain-containing protein n=1 Tax=Timema tahoe TaxID=61484 RepID=A0A7R9NYQ7_9NEOP|nr:unnamed protein product [Timema tahoe]